MSNNANIWEVGGGVNATSYMPIAGGTFTGDVLGITKPKGDNSNSFATTAFVYAAIVALGMGTLGLQNANAVSITGGTIDGTSIGATTPASGKFSTLNSTGATSLGATSATGIDNTPIGATTPSSGVFNSLKNNATLPAADNSTNAATTAWTVANFVKPNTAVTFSALDNTPIGQTTPAAGKFTNALVYSGSIGTYAFLGIGRTGNDLVLGVAANANELVTGSAASDTILNTNTSTGNMLFAHNGNLHGKWLNNGNFQVGSGADTGDKFQVFGGSYLNGKVNLNNKYSALDSDSSYLYLYAPGTSPGSQGVKVMNNSGSAYAPISTSGVSFNNSATALNAYEEGTFTPTISGSTTAGTPTYTTQWGTYTRIGRLVNFKLRIAINSLGGMGGTVSFGGLPHITANDGQNGSALISYYNGITLGSGYTQLHAVMGIGNSSLTPYETGSNVSPNTLSTTSLASTVDIIISGTYNI